MSPNRNRNQGGGGGGDSTTTTPPTETPTEAPEAKEPTRDELMAQAKALDIEGRSSMNKEQLAAAIKDVEENGPKEKEPVFRTATLGKRIKEEDLTRLTSRRYFLSERTNKPGEPRQYTALNGWFRETLVMEAPEIAPGIPDPRFDTKKGGMYALELLVDKEHNRLDEPVLVDFYKSSDTAFEVGTALFGYTPMPEGHQPRELIVEEAVEAYHRAQEEAAKAAEEEANASESTESETAGAPA